MQSMLHGVVTAFGKESTVVGSAVFHGHHTAWSSLDVDDTRSLARYAARSIVHSSFAQQAVHVTQNAHTPFTRSPRAFVVSLFFYPSQNPPPTYATKLYKRLYARTNANHTLPTLFLFNDLESSACIDVPAARRGVWSRAPPPPLGAQAQAQAQEGKRSLRGSSG